MCFLNIKASEHFLVENENKRKKPENDHDMRSTQIGPNSVLMCNK